MQVVATRPVYKIADHDGVPVYAKYGRSPTVDPLDKLLCTIDDDLAKGTISTLDIDEVQGKV